jgi:hypothetical protein
VGELFDKSPVVFLKIIVKDSSSVLSVFIHEMSTENIIAGHGKIHVFIDG